MCGVYVCICGVCECMFVVCMCVYNYVPPCGEGAELLIQGVSKPEANLPWRPPTSLPEGCFRDDRESELPACNDLPDDQEALVERNRCKVEHGREDGLREGGSGVTESHGGWLVGVTESHQGSGCHQESWHWPHPHTIMCLLQGSLRPSQHPRRSGLFNHPHERPREGQGLAQEHTAQL